MKSKAIEAPKSEIDKRTEQIATLIPKARKDEKAAAQLWKLLEEKGTADNFVRGADIAWQAERSLIELYNRDDVLGRQMSARRLKLLRRELDGENPTALEKLLVDRIALCWLHLHLCEVVAAQKGQDCTMAQGIYYQKILDGANKRYLASIKALAQVRKLQLPNVQLNIAEKQVNIGEVKAAS